MPDIPLDFRAIEYVTDLGVAVRAMRAFVDVEFPTQADTTVDFDCFVDIGAPFSVIPYSLWHDRSIRWRRLGSVLTLAGTPSRPVPDALLWQGASCELGETEVYLIDPVARLQTGPHRVLALGEIRPAASQGRLGVCCHPRIELRDRQQHPSGSARTCWRGNGLSVRPVSLTQA